MQIVMVLGSIQLQKVEQQFLVIQAQVQVVMFENHSERVLIDMRVLFPLTVGPHAFKSESVQELDV